ncbi:transketolase [Candidatus Gracilibacteria bacterium]|nr:transketolase [Candidatus Gracilibacteria bacterium]MCF7819698.1 transketolase [Candidatus Gracilibacteria bacterium]
MDFSFPSSDQKLGPQRLKFLDTFRKSCKRTILQMLRTSQSGHPGGSLSSLNILSVLYAFRLSQTEEKIVVSNGHISPGVYSILAEMGVVDPEDVIQGFRQIGSVFEGHVTRHIPGIYYGTGPLGIGVSVASGMAVAEKKKKTNKKVFVLVGDGELQEGQVHEMMLFAAKYKLNNFVVFVDANRVQLSDSLQNILPIDIAALFSAAKWNVLRIDGHDDEAIWHAIGEADKSDRPTVVVAETIMGKGIPELEEDGRQFKATWHGKVPKPDVIDQMLEKMPLDLEEQGMLATFRQDRNFRPPRTEFPDDLSPISLECGEPYEYSPDEMTDCRSAYGKALLDLAQRNKNVLASTADLSGSVKTDFVEKKLPDQFLEFGIAEQNMVSANGGLSLSSFVPFCSTFGAFMTSRAKDQARVNDINRTNVKMVSTHCGLSVGEDGPTHQVIDDMGSMEGLFHTHAIEPADPNHCDRIIRYAATHYGNFYVRMGRHKIPVLTKEDGSILYDKEYQYEYGKCDLLRTGKKVTIVASGPMVIQALKAREETGIDAEIIIASSNKQFDTTLEDSLRKTKKVLIVQDHNPYSGIASGVARFVAERNISLDFYQALGVREYQLSGKPEELYRSAGIGQEAIEEVLKKI